MLSRAHLAQERTMGAFVQTCEHLCVPGLGTGCWAADKADNLPGLQVPTVWRVGGQGVFDTQ